MSFFAPLNLFFTVLMFAALAVQAWALVDAAIRPSNAYVAADKQTKNLWLVILGLALAVTLFLSRGILSLFAIAGLIAAIVYLVDVRPAVREVQGRGRSNNGPYGPW